ncbi:MAG: TonB-dependent receptor [Pyrinomonadaceae bacterium]|nr:TonB-dependent receptor [Pyrinomonadaceae bacterium]
MRPYKQLTGVIASLITTAAPFAVILLCSSVHAQSTASIEGQVNDQHGAIVPGVEITAVSRDYGIRRAAVTDGDGRYQIVALPVGSYRIELRAPGFQTQIIESSTLEVGRRVTHNFQLQVGDVSQMLTVQTDRDLIDRSTMAVGHVVDQRMVQETPLNGRYFLDLGLRVAGSVTPPQGAFSASPSRGLGSLAINTGGNREETVNYMVNGITLNNLSFSSISFQLPINTIQEFKLDNSTFSAQYGQSSGAIVNIATRSGANEFHGELFEFFRNDVLDARNFFEFTSKQPAPFKRNQFGGNLGGPIIKKKVFFFSSYEGLRQRQGLNLNSVVLSDAQRASVTDPVVAKLVGLIPRANLVDSSGTPRFISSASAPVNVDQWTTDISYNLSERTSLHGYHAIQRAETREPNRTGSTIPGFGHTSRALRQIFTLNLTHTFATNVVNEARAGFNRFSSRSTPNAQLNPADFGILNGVNQPIGLPQINVAGGGLNFGGPAAQPSGRNDTTFVVADTMSWLYGPHSLKIGGEYRQFLTNNFRQGTGSFNFATVAAFLAGTANSFSVTLGNQTSHIAQGALGFFVQDNYKPRPDLTLELGLRYEWNMTPSERDDRFIVFDPSTASLVRVGTDLDAVYRENNKNFQPRVGVAWTPFRNGKTVLRGAYGIYVDQPMTSIVSPTSGNPPLAIPLTFTGTVRLDNAINVARPAGLAPQTVDHDFDNAYMQSWNLNAQHEFSEFALMVGYIGSKGTNLITRRNLNQVVNGVRPYPALSLSSPILPGTPLGNITQVEGTGNSSYNALWVTATRRLTNNVQVDASYTWSKSLDYNSFSSGGIVAQNSYDLVGSRGLSDFDARHRLAVSAIYGLPFRGNQLVEGWQFAAIVQLQSGNPVNIVTTNSTVNGVAGTLRPDVSSPINIVGRVDAWFDTSVFAPVTRFGNLGRNVVIGPTFNNTDFSITKTTKFGDALRLQFRTEFFDIFNRANLGQPGNTVGSPSFGRITNTRFPTGESGSSRQIQFALRLLF